MLNTYPKLPSYRGDGQPAFADIRVPSVPPVGAQVEIGGDTYVMGTDFSGRDIRRVAASLTVAINAPYGTDLSGVVKPYFAEVRGDTVVVIATQPGTVGNTITLSATSPFVLSGNTLTGGSSGTQSLNINFTEAVSVSVAQVTFNEAGFTSLPSAPARRFDFLNATQATIGFRRVGGTTVFDLPPGTGKVFNCVANTNEWEVTRRSGTGSLTVPYEVVAAGNQLAQIDSPVVNWDWVGFSPASLPTTITYRQGGASGTIVAQFTVTYSGTRIATISRTT